MRACGVCELQRDLRVGVAGGWLSIVLGCRPSSTRSVAPLWDTPLPSPLPRVPGRRSDGLACTCALELDLLLLGNVLVFRFLGFFIVFRTSHTELCLFLLFLERRTPNSDRPQITHSAISIAGKLHSLFSGIAEDLARRSRWGLRQQSHESNPGGWRCIGWMQ